VPFCVCRYAGAYVSMTAPLSLCVCVCVFCVRVHASVCGGGHAPYHLELKLGPGCNNVAGVAVRVDDARIGKLAQKRARVEGMQRGLEHPVRLWAVPIAEQLQVPP
jgi:hypothetical protein